MVIDRGETKLTRLTSPSRRAAFRAHGALRFIDGVQGAVDDIEGAIKAGQHGVVAFQARYVVLNCLSILSLATEGEIEFDEESVSFDFFLGLPADTVAKGLALANEAVDVDAASANAWMQRLRAYVADTESVLGYDAPLPVLRSPEGAFGLIRLTRLWSAALEEFGLPALLKTEWVRNPGDAPETAPTRARPAAADPRQ